MIQPTERAGERMGHDIVVIGGSAGGLVALQALLEQLDAALPASLFVVLHQSAGGPGLIPTILARRSRLPIVAPTDGTLIRPGQVYVAPPNAHLFLQRDRVRLLRGPPENTQRPSIDTLFRSAAVTYGPRVVGVVLSGSLDDGTAGLEAIKTCGGIAMVQSPEEAAHPEMPSNALADVDIDHTLPVQGLADMIGRLAEAPVDGTGESHPVPEHLKIETEFALLARDLEDMDKVGPLAGYVCPTCNGSLWKVESEGLLRFRCHVGHAFSTQTLLSEQGEGIERALYSALRLLEERARAARQLARRRIGGGRGDGMGFEAKALELEETAAVLRRLIVQGARQLDKPAVEPDQARRVETRPPE